MFRPVEPAIWRWCGRALSAGALPVDGKTPVRMAVLRSLLELSAEASDAEVEAELELFKAQGKRRG